MVHKSKVIAGISRYIDAHIMPMLKGTFAYWIAGGLFAMEIRNADQMLSELMNKPYAKSRGLVDGDNIDVDKLYAEIRPWAEKEAAIMDVKGINQTIKFTVADLETLYKYIKEA